MYESFNDLGKSMSEMGKAMSQTFNSIFGEGGVNFSNGNIQISSQNGVSVITQDGKTTIIKNGKKYVIDKDGNVTVDGENVKSHSVDSDTNYKKTANNAEVKIPTKVMVHKNLTTPAMMADLDSLELKMSELNTKYGNTLNIMVLCAIISLVSIVISVLALLG